LKGHDFSRAAKYKTIQKTQNADRKVRVVISLVDLRCHCNGMI